MIYIIQRHDLAFLKNKHDFFTIFLLKKQKKSEINLEKRHPHLFSFRSHLDIQFIFVHL